MAVNERMAAAWQRASADLGIRVEAPFRLAWQADGEDVVGEAFLPDFASPGGGHALWRENLTAWRAVKAAGGWASLLYDGYLEYDRKRFIETLRDWGWFGAPDEAPAWLREPPP